MKEEDEGKIDNKKGKTRSRSIICIHFISNSFLFAKKILVHFYILGKEKDKENQEKL